MSDTRFLKKTRTAAGLLSGAYREFRQNDPLRMAGATAFFASFALPPILIILIRLFGLFGNPRSISRDLFTQLGNIIDRDTVSQIRVTLRNVWYLPLNTGMKTGVFIFLLFVATTLFTVIKNSLNQLWLIRPRKTIGVKVILLQRVKSIGIILLAGLLFFIVLHLFLRGIVYRVASRLAVTGWLILLFKYLADGRPAWKVAVPGGIFTGFLFTIGEFVLHLVFSFSKVRTIYGASTALVLLLLFIFYASFIFYYGACFTKTLAAYYERPILPTSHAVCYTLQSVEWEREMH